MVVVVLFLVTPVIAVLVDLKKKIREKFEVFEQNWWILVRARMNAQCANFNSKTIISVTSWIMMK